jgi:hypothetical protein
MEQGETGYSKYTKFKVLSFTKVDTLKQLRPIGKGDQELEKRLDQKELT